MLESNIHAGKQTWKPQVEPEYGISITDACIGWSDTERLLEEAASAVASRGPRAGTAMF
jgi:3-deoxy-7-phosphoheptulonate synthase